jgi:hypothetical protein
MGKGIRYRQKLYKLSERAECFELKLKMQPSVTFGRPWIRLTQHIRQLTMMNYQLNINDAS